MMPDKVRNYLLDRKDALERQIVNLEVEKGRLLEILNNKEVIPSILPKEAKRIWPKSDRKGYRILYKGAQHKDFELIKKHYRTIGDAKSECAGMTSETIIIDVDGNEIERYDRGD